MPRKKASAPEGVLPDDLRKSLEEGLSYLIGRLAEIQVDINQVEEEAHRAKLLARRRLICNTIWSLMEVL